MRRLTGFAATALMLLTACSSGSADGFGAPDHPNAAVETVFDGPDLSIEIVRPTDSPSCWQIRVGTETSSCMSLQYRDGDTSHRIITGERSFVALTAGGDERVSVVWFSSLHDGLVLDSYPVDPSQVVIVELADDEEPWGMQILDADGALVSAVSFIDQD